MPQRDIFHQVVKISLIKDGWTITHDPLTLFIGARKSGTFTILYIGHGSKKRAAAPDGNQ